MHFFFSQNKASCRIKARPAKTHTDISQHLNCRTILHVPPSPRRLFTSASLEQGPALVMSDRAVVRWTVWNSRHPGNSKCTHCGCMQTVWTPLQERENELGDGWGDERDRGLGWPNRTCLHRRLTVMGQNLNCFSFPNFISWNAWLSPSTRVVLLLLLLDSFCFFLNAHSDTFYDVQTKKKMSDYSWPFHLSEFCFLCVVLCGKEKQRLNLKWEWKTTIWTWLLFVKYNRQQYNRLK